MPVRFPMGRVVATPNVLKAVSKAEIFAALQRHQNCDWGDVSPDDKKTNDNAIRNKDRLFSAYHGKDGTKFWIITEWDRSATTVLLPEEY